MKNRIILFIIAVLVCLGSRASLIERADSAYTSKNYEEAALLYQQSIDEDGVSAGVLYNLGNTYYRLGKDGEAMVCYERAKKLDPGNDRINQNLNFLATKVLDANKGELKGKNGNLDPDSENLIAGFYRMIAAETQSNSWAVFAVMAFLLFLGALALYIFTPNVLARKTGFFSGLVFLGFTVIFLIFAFMGAGEYTRDDKVVLMDFKTSLREQPADTSGEVSSPLHKGTKLTVLEARKGEDGKEWLKVRLNSENIGWVKKDGVEII